MLVHMCKYSNGEWGEAMGYEGGLGGGGGGNCPLVPLQSRKNPESLVGVNEILKMFPSPCECVVRCSDFDSFEDSRICL